jgi:hypothetical protein
MKNVVPKGVVIKREATVKRAITFFADCRLYHKSVTIGTGKMIC